ncbi:hypothetical protein HOV93_13730 [Planctomycetes bacterium FF15]|uniref:Uncharacterized protein n=1 Tax=Bremerella alba TaxID=980252 RepID=A0A7V9A6E0_9BACT|nr:hypothetical protein [Bremerella alba]
MVADLESRGRVVVTATDLELRAQEVVTVAVRELLDQEVVTVVVPALAVPAAAIQVSHGQATTILKIFSTCLENRVVTVAIDSQIGQVQEIGLAQEIGRTRVIVLAMETDRTRETASPIVLDQATGPEMAIVSRIVLAMAMEIGSISAMVIAPTSEEAIAITSTLILAIVKTMPTAFATSGPTSTMIAARLIAIGGMVDIMGTIMAGIGTTTGIGIQIIGAGGLQPGRRLALGLPGQRGLSRTRMITVQRLSIVTTTSM